MLGLLAGKSKAANHVGEIRSKSSPENLYIHPKSGDEKSNPTSTGASPDSKITDSSNPIVEKKTIPTSIGQKIVPSSGTSAQTNEIQRIRISGKPYKDSITGALNESLLNILRKVNYDPTNKYKQNVPQTFPLVLMPVKNIDIKPPVNGKSSNKGMTEESFCRDFLMNYFKNQVYDSLTVFIGSNPYEPDLAFVDLTSGKNIFIDIEIDEPYDGVTRKPTHYRTQNGTSDDYRNQGFTDRGWMVIRFAEEQIFTSPNECVKFIGEVIKSVNPIFSSSCLSFPNDLKRISMWNEAEASKFAEERKREKYLGISEFFASGGPRNLAIKDSSLGKEIETKISQNKSGITITGSTLKSTPIVKSPPIPDLETKIPIPTSKVVAPPIIASTYKTEEPRVTTKTTSPSQPSPKPYAY